MCNEFIRYIRYMRHYPLDSFSSVLLELIFICGILSYSSDLTNFSIVSMALLYIPLSACQLANAELEFEIRSQQIGALTSARKSIFHIYLLRMPVYIFISTFSFLVALIFCVFLQHLSFSESAYILSPEFVVACLLHVMLALVLYMLCIGLTLRYERIATALGFFTWLAIAFSGMVFPLTYPNYWTLLQQVGHALSTLL